MYLNTGSVGGAHFGSLSINGQFRSASATSMNYAYDLSFVATGVDPSYSVYRWVGFPLRGINSKSTFFKKFNYNFTIYPSLYFVRSGYTNNQTSHIRHIGNNSYNWSTMTSTKRGGSGAKELSAYSLVFDTATIFTSYGPDLRWYGLPLRCSSEQKAAPTHLLNTFHQPHHTHHPQTKLPEHIG